MKEQFIGFFRGCFSVITGNGDLDIFGDDGSLQAFHLAQNRIHYVDGIGTRTFGNRKRYGGLFRSPLAVTEQDIGLRFFRAIGNSCHISKIDRFAAINTNDDPADFPGGFEKGAGLQQYFPVTGEEVAGDCLPVGLLQGRNQPVNAQVSGRKFERIEEYAHLPAVAAY